MSAATADDRYDIRKGMPVLAMRLLTAFGILAMLSLAILIAGKLYGRTLVHAGHTASTEKVAVEIGGDRLSIPANMIRKRDQRQPGPANRVDLYIHWPSITGFQSRLADAFNNVEPETNAIVFVSIMPRATTRDMAGRFDPVYRRVVRGTAVAAHPGLWGHALSPKHGYIDERLYYSVPETPGGARFVARCQEAGPAQVILAPCETDIHFGETLTAQIRFPQRLMAEWKGLQAALPVYLRDLIAREVD